MSEPEGTSGGAVLEPYDACPERLFQVVLWVSIALVFVVRLKDPDLTWFGTDMSRDLARALEWIKGSPSSYLGPEIGHGPRMPGPAYYWLLAVAWKLTQSVPGTLTLIHFGIIGISLWFLHTVVRPLGRTPTLVFWLTFALLPTQVLTSRMLWSPSLVVPINLLSLICFAKCQASGNRKWIAPLPLLAVLALQVHLTALAGPVVCIACICWNQRTWAPGFWFTAFTSLYLAVAWSASRHYLSMLDVIRRDYTLLPGLGRQPYSWSSFGHSLSSHLFVAPEPLRWDELYTVTFHLGPKVLEASTFAWIERFLVLRAPLTALVLGGFLLLVVRVLRGQATPLEKVTLSWTALAFLALTSYKFGRGTIPYRYGLSLYPFQFLVVAMGIGQLAQSIRSKEAARFASFCAVSFAGLIFVGNGFFLWQSYRVSELTGRISETGVYNELTLRHKLQLIESGGVAQAESFMASLHGPVANRVRNAEFYHWTQRRWSAGLYQSLERVDALSRNEAPQHYYLRLTPLQETLALTSSAVELIPLYSQDLPSEVSFRYLDEHGSLLKTVTPASSETLLPCLNAPASASRVRVAFRMSESRGPVAICFDDHRYYRALSLGEDSIQVDGRPAKFRTQIPSRLNQRMVVLDNPSTFGCVVDFQIYQHGTYSRLDIFRIPDTL